MSRTGLYYGNCCRKACCESITTEKIDFFFYCIVPRMASTMPSFSTSIDPEQTRNMAWSASPCRRRYSPGVQKEVLVCRDRDRRQPRLAEANSDSSRISLLRCMVMSDRSSSGKSFSSCGDDERKRGRERDGENGKSEAGVTALEKCHAATC